MTLTPMIFQQDPEAGGVCPKIVGQLLAVVLQSGQLDKIGTHPAGALPFPGRGDRFRLGIGGGGSCGRWIERPATEERGWKNPSATPGVGGCIIENQFCPARPRKPLVGAAFCAATPRPLRHREPGVRVKTRVREPSFCRVPELEPGVGAEGFTATPAPSKTRVRGESPSYRNHLFVGAASAATLASSRTRGSYRAGFTATKRAFTATLASSKAEVRGESLSDDRRSGGGQRPAVALPGPQGAMGGARWPLPRSDHCRVMSRRTTARGCPAISGHLLRGGRLG
jgi:hypothetical protein